MMAGLKDGMETLGRSGMGGIVPVMMAGAADRKADKAYQQQTGHDPQRGPMPRRKKRPAGAPGGALGMAKDMMDDGGDYYA